MLLIFECGCRLSTFWSNELKEEKIYLGCCHSHEKEHQKIENILPLNLIKIKFEDGKSD